ncbi:ABC transporter permease [Leuconostoc falkenbergense]|uniref:ABC transporter permease n=1 Tax=Leuconostoc falkenbergense TaxID=2766470 RepID=UPI002A801B29|nr:ABC transporter permease [Leuconostoc falkenbergense]MDY5163530.1 ABC transporter permease [Leuconostoc falkenbergense]
MKNQKKASIMSTTLTMAHRNLLKTWHNPDNLSDVIIQPIIFTLLFGFLFGGVIAGSVHAYLPMLVSGILIQSILNAAAGSGQQLREDINSGIFDRFKTLPISAFVPLAGQLIGDALRLLLSGLISLGTAFAIGWATSWIFVLVGLLVKNAELIGSLSMIIILVMTFLSNAFIPIRTLPLFLQSIVQLNPVTITISAIRAIMKTGYWNTEATLVIISGIIIIAIFMPLSLMVYRKNN